jgi:hypothetical protein
MALSDRLAEFVRWFEQNAVFCSHRRPAVGIEDIFEPIALVRRRGSVLAWDAHTTLPHAASIKVFDIRTVEDARHIDDVDAVTTYVFRKARGAAEKALHAERAEYVDDNLPLFEAAFKRRIEEVAALPVPPKPTKRFLFSRWHVLDETGFKPAGVVFPIGNGFRFHAMRGYEELSQAMDGRLQYNGLGDEEALRELINRSGRNEAFSEPEYIKAHDLGDALARAITRFAADIYAETGKVTL